jgi:hypothetical protein
VPEAIAFVVSSGRAGTATFNNLGGVANYWLLGRERLAGRTVRLVGQLPARGQPPYHLSVNTTDAGGRRSTYVEMPLTCPGTRCLEGFLPGQDLPTPLLATRGLTPALLERSLRQVLSGEPGWTRVTAVRCASTTACQADFTDPVVHARVRIDYAIEGEQRRGCWLGGSTRRTVTPPNARIVGTSDSRIGGCVSWLR